MISPRFSSRKKRAPLHSCAGAYKNPDGQIIVVVQNELSKRNRLAIAVDGKGINTEVPPHSITTFIVTK